MRFVELSKGAVLAALAVERVGPHAARTGASGTDTRPRSRQPESDRASPLPAPAPCCRRASQYTLRYVAWRPSQAPWIKLLDAYGISRLRADGHLGQTTRGAGGPVCAFTGLRPPCHDCVHYCLPGVPDVINGRLLQLLLDAAHSQPPEGGKGRGGERHAYERGTRRDLGRPRLRASPRRLEGSADAVLARWNPWWHGVEPLIQHDAWSRHFAMQLTPFRGRPMRLLCPTVELHATLERSKRGIQGVKNESRALLGVCSSTTDPG